MLAFDFTSRLCGGPRALLPGLAPDFDWRYHLVTNTSRLRGRLGFVEPVVRAEALRRTVAWERAHPPGEVGSAAFDYAAEDAVLASGRKGARVGSTEAPA